jgi:redox-sensitive bicupin YhaK (pirin superfamily)
MSMHSIKRVRPLGFPWETSDPFLFCAHHDDAYPRANPRLGPAASLVGRNLGQDFSRKDGWSMYHGRTVPGFPAHPHRGFETITLVRQGLIDHSDSLGAAARFGRGDVQWVTAGRGIVHSEMFPLLAADTPNPVELFQIWLNLPASAKMSEPYFTMFWSEQIARRIVSDAHGRTTEVAIVAGRYDAPTLPMALAPAPPPSSWAAQSATDVAIWTVRMSPGAQWTLPAAAPGTQRTLYFFRGHAILIDGELIDGHAAIEPSADRAVQITNTAGDIDAELLLLQGQPIGEPVAQHGPFVMNTPVEIQQAFADFQRTQFGGWPWPDDAPVHGSEPARFARHADGRREVPEGEPRQRR